MNLSTFANLSQIGCFIWLAYKEIWPMFSTGQTSWTWKELATAGAFIVWAFSFAYVALKSEPSSQQNKAVEIASLQPNISNVCFHDPVKVLKQTYVEFPPETPPEMRFGKAALIELSTSEEFSTASYIVVHTKQPSSIVWAKVGKDTQGEEVAHGQNDSHFIIRSMMGPNRITRIYLVTSGPFEVLCADRIPKEALHPDWQKRI